MSHDPSDPVADSKKLQRLAEAFDRAIQGMAAAPSFTKIAWLPRVLDAARRLLSVPGGCAEVEDRAQAYEAAGLFSGSDWDHPEILVPGLAAQGLREGSAQSIMLECLSELRFLAVARDRYQHPGLSAEQARHFLSQVMALNLELLFGPPTETERVRLGALAPVVRGLVQHLAESIGYEHVIEKLVDEIWRVMGQRPLQTESVKAMVSQIAICRSNPQVELGAGAAGADRLISGLFGPTKASREDPGLEVYRQRLASVDTAALQQEATGFARAMHDTGLVSPYHPVLLRFLLEDHEELLAEALGLSSTGRDCLLCYRLLVRALIHEAVHPETAQAVYGLALLLERGILYAPPVAPGLWRQIALPMSATADSRLRAAFGDAQPPRVHLLAGVVAMLGQPLGVGQGNNPTCQSARALSMWAYNDPDYLLQIVAWAARDDEVVFHFEGQPVSSARSGRGLATSPVLDLDAVSVVVVPHLDRIYNAMGRRCYERGEDPHRWVNPEFHGWWVGRGFRIAVDVATGKLREPEGFIRHFYSSYHPYYNGNQPVIHPQPAGVAVTDSAGRFVGWHAISIIRVALDPERVMRVYFFNPNNDSGQDWGQGVRVSTEGHGERFGEASLPVEQFISRLYIFHFDPLERGSPEAVPSEDVAAVLEMIHGSWGADRRDAGTLQAEADGSGEPGPA